MAFQKDILLIDFETTGYDSAKSDPIQLGAVLLDKDSLEEKDSFVSMIHAKLDLSDPFVKEWGLPVDEIEKAPTIGEVAEQFKSKFGFDVLLGSWTYSLDRAMMAKLLGAINEDLSVFDYHHLDLWPVAYMHLLKKGYSGPMRSDEMFGAFGFPKRPSRHDALEDCRIEAEILRKIFFGWA